MDSTRKTENVTRGVLFSMPHILEPLEDNSILLIGNCNPSYSVILL
jgi:hypothetical protein